eukprot:gene16998-8503_t
MEKIAVVLVIFSAVARPKVSASDEVFIRIVPSSRLAIPKLVAANFPFDPPILVEVVNNRSERITTGSNSALIVWPVLSNSSLCISNDSRFVLQNGLGSFSGSICSSTPEVSITFAASTANGTAIVSEATPNITVTGEIHIAHFVKGVASGNDVAQVLVEGAVSDINEGISRYSDGGFILPGRKIFIRNYNHAGSRDESINAYRKMIKDRKVDPASRAQTILGFNSNLASRMLLPMAMIDQISVLSYANDTLSEFSDKDKYPYFSRLTYSKSTRYHGLIVYLVSRKWQDIILVETADSKIGKEFADQCNKSQIRIRYQVTFPVIENFNQEPAGKFAKHFARINSVGTKIIVTVAKKPTSFYMFAEAMSQNITSKNGFQWIGFDSEEDFPHANQPKRCHENMGMTFVSPYYNINGFSSPQWQSLWKRYFDVDTENEQMDAMTLWKSGGAGGLAYDAVHMYAFAIRKLIDMNMTVTGPAVAKTIRSIQFSTGMMSNLSMTSNGEPSKFLGRLSLVWPNQDSFDHFHGGKVQAGLIEPWDWSLARVLSNPTNGFFIIEPPESNYSVEVKSDGGPHMVHTIDWMHDAALKTGYIKTGPTFRNLRRYRSFRGLFSLGDQVQVEESWEFSQRHKRERIWLEEIEREEFILLPFRCELGCGGNNSDPEDFNLYDNGYCAGENMCICFKDSVGNALWDSKTCSNPVCKSGCIHGNCSSTSCSPEGGYCIAPSVCSCRKNFYGYGCSKKCACKYGMCNSGQFGDGACLSCDTGYVGENCTVSIYAVVFPMIIGLALLSAIMTSCISCYMRRSKIKAELLNDDWVVTWSQVKRSDKRAERNMFFGKDTLNESRARSKRLNTGTWKGIDVYFQKFNKPSIMATDSLRLDVKILKVLEHQNLVRFVGACLASPNVAVLTELAAKDICCGLEYLHQSEIGSHGRLKSSNCLIDSRWTLKLSGFGLRSFREEREDLSKVSLAKRNTFPIDIEAAEDGYFHLLWTAPEILKTGVQNLDQVGYGTKEGDVYSFAIVSSEICTRESPFEKLFLTNKEKIELIAGNTTPAITRIWNTYLASKNTEAGSPVRPCIAQSQWPVEPEQSKPLRLLIDRCWTSDPSLRPIPKDALKNLERVDPDNGQAMNKLVTMLERYSNNLEDIVNDRAKALNQEKQKTENLVSRLLPRPIVEDLKLGKNIEAEKFECISVLFSDLVDFHTISDLSSPFQVIETLNDLYNRLDSVVMGFDAHKIETVGSSYMVVSGLPILNGDRHAEVISDIALEFIEVARSMRIRHLPGTQLRLRIGIHSGDAAAGVVGLRVPRYCVFGGTVNIASNMEATCEPMRIQLTNDSMQLIRNSGNFKVEFRGGFDYKDCGYIESWWLIGRTSNPDEEN